MQLIVILGCIIMVVLAFVLNKAKLFSPIKLFFCLWTLIMILSCIHISELNVPSNEAYALILLMLESFLLGNAICIFVNNRRKEVKDNVNHTLYKKLFYIICIMVITLNVIDAIIVFKHLFNGVPMWQIRNWTLAPFNSNNPILSRRSFIESFIRNVVFEPFGLLIHPVAAYYLFFDENKKDKKIMIILSILTVISVSLAGGGGRLTYVYFVMCYLLAFFTFRKSAKSKSSILKKYKKVIIAFTLIAFAIVIGFTVIRSGGRGFANETYRYFAMPPTLLSEWLPKIKVEPHTYGLLTTFGIHSYFFRGLNQVGMTSLVPNIFNDSFRHLLNAERFINIGSGNANAFVTPVYYFYLDGGFIFVVIASLFFGFLITHVFNRIDKKLDVRNFMLYMIIMYGVFVSFMRIQTAIPSYIIAILFVYILTKKDTGKKHKINNVVNNSIMLFIFNIAKIVFPFITLPYLTRVLTKDTYGTVTYVKTVMTYMQVFVDFGFVLSGTKDIVKNLHDKEKLNTIIGDTLIARTILGIIGFIIVLALSFTLPILKGNELYALLSYTAVFGSIYLMDFIFRGYEKMHVIAIRFILMKTISTIFTFILIENDSNILLIPILDIISTFIAMLLVFFEMKKLDIHIKISRLTNIFTKIKDSFIYFLSNASSTSFNALSTIVIGIYLGKTDVANWGLCMQVIGTIQACYTPITDGIYPEMIRAKNIKLIKKIEKIFIPIIILGCVFAYFLAPFGIKILGGKKYLEAVPIFRLLIPCLFVGFLGMLYGWPVLGPINKQKEVTKSTIYSAIINILMLFILIAIDRFTIVYIAIARILTELSLFIFRYGYYRKYKTEYC